MGDKEKKIYEKSVLPQGGVLNLRAPIGWKMGKMGTKA
jgi:hypothetical protein